MAKHKSSGSGLSTQSDAYLKRPSQVKRQQRVEKESGKRKKQHSLDPGKKVSSSQQPQYSAFFTWYSQAYPSDTQKFVSEKTLYEYMVHMATTRTQYGGYPAAKTLDVRCSTLMGLYRMQTLQSGNPHPFPKPPGGRVVVLLTTYRRGGEPAVKRLLEYTEPQSGSNSDSELETEEQPEESAKGGVHVGVKGKSNNGLEYFKARVNELETTVRLLGEKVDQCVGDVRDSHMEMYARMERHYATMERKMDELLQTQSKNANGSYTKGSAATLEEPQRRQ